jgi:prolyl oligopeptidase
MRFRLVPAVLLASQALLLGTALADDTDPYLWLEDVDGARALDWVKARSAADAAELEAVPEFPDIHKALLDIYNSEDRIPTPDIEGAWIYNFWQDADHVRGIWRRTSLDAYANEAPNWETVLDLDALADSESENWVWKGAKILPPEHRLALVSLSRGGGDAVVVREFDTEARAFVNGGFDVPEAKSDVAWKDANTIWVATDFGEGSLTTYLNRGTLVKLDVPVDAEIQTVFQNRLLVSLRSDWTAGGTTYAAGSLLAIDLDRFLAGDRNFDRLFEPQERVSLASVSATHDAIIMSTLDNVKGRLYRLVPGEDGWSREEIPLPGLGSVSMGSTSESDDTFFFTYSDFLTPSSLYLCRDGGAPVKVKTTPAFFDSKGMQVAQYETPSKDGTLIPYFVVTPPGFKADGQAPTVLYGYGGFEIAEKPRYTGSVGAAWVGRGGVWVLANIRGGGEFGPKWHEAALKEKHQNVFDDFIAVAEDLVARKITSRDHLGIMGGSNGGLLVGGCFVQRPELYRAVVCQVPLLDMKRYNKLLAGASWMAEFGNPDTDDWNFMKKWSPYQNLDPDKTYPKVLFVTSTRDDRVHPGHARKMVAKMTDMGKPCYYYENTEGGHGAAANNNQRAYMWALTYAYLWKMLRPEANPG